MRVKVSPPYEGAGSWEDEVVSKFRTTIDGVRGDAYLLKSRMQVPANICKEIPSITPEPGDICQSNDNDEIFILTLYQDGKWYTGATEYWTNARVLARKPKGYEEIQQQFKDIINNSDTSYRENYDAIVALILGGAEYALLPAKGKEARDER